MANIIDSTPGAIVVGTCAPDLLYGTGGDNIYYGGAGNDAFVLSAKALRASSGFCAPDHSEIQGAIVDFSGAGGWNACNNDFIALTGFGAGSTMTLGHYGTDCYGCIDRTMQYYTLHDTAQNVDYTIFIHSTDGCQLSTAKGDFNFYGSTPTPV